jgi:hypothetical protein
MVSVKVLLPDGKIRVLAAEVSNGPPWWLAFRDLDGVPQRFEALDLFEALIAMRRSFEERGCRLLCAGARPNAWPSAMSRDMGGGRKVFIVQMGMYADLDTLVDIFDYAEPGAVGTVEEQRAYRPKWLDSFRKRQ